MQKYKLLQDRIQGRLELTKEKLGLEGLCKEYGLNPQEKVIFWRLLEKSI